MWGPCAWKFLHSIAFAYPAAPSDEQIAAHTKFFEALPDVIPCPSCGFHCRTYFESNREELSRALRSGPVLARFMHKFHNAVNASRTPPVKPMDWETVRQIYTYGHADSRPRPQSAAEWADPYHNMPQWSESAGQDATTVLDFVSSPAAITCLLLLAATYYYYFSRRESSAERKRAQAPWPLRAHTHV